MGFFDFFKRKRVRVIIVEETLYRDISVLLNNLAKIWLLEGAEEVVIALHPKGAGLSPKYIRDFLIGIRRSLFKTLQGVLFIGELPVAFFEQSGSPSSASYTSDYYFMELTNVYTIHEANVVSTPLKRPPTICAGRIFIGSDTGMGSGLPIHDLYKRILQKTIDYRIDGDDYRQRNKAVMVTNLSGYDAYLAHLCTLYPSSSVTGYDGAPEALYKQILETPYDWILYYGHSSGGGHDMPNGQIWNPIEYFRADIKINMFQFESCSTGEIAWMGPSDPANPTSPRAALAMSETFSSSILANKSRGVLVFAPSCGGFFNRMDAFYGYLRSGMTYGSAFRKWMAGEIASERPHYMSLYGDPFMRFEQGFPHQLTGHLDDLLRRASDYLRGRSIKLVTIRLS